MAVYLWDYSIGLFIYVIEDEMMTEHTYKHIELTGSSAESSDQAIQNAIAKASETIKHLHWFQVIDTRGYIDDNAVKYWQVTIKVGFRIED